MKTGPKGATEPIRSKQHIDAIKQALAERPRDLALFTLGVNSAFRGSDLLSLNVGDVRGKLVLTIREQKTGKTRSVTLNGVTRLALETLCEGRDAGEPLFVGEKRGTRLTIGTFGRLVKEWCASVGLYGNYSAHSLRKTWGYHARSSGAPLDTLVKAFNHSSGAITLQYLGILDAEVQALYEMEL